MKKLQVVLVGIILLFGMQFTMVSCEANDLEFNNNVEQIQNETKMVVPGHAGDEDDDDDEGTS